MNGYSLHQLAIAAVRDSGLLASSIQNYISDNLLTWETAATELSVTQEQLDRLALCRLPRTSQETSDIGAIGQYTGIEPARLGMILETLQPHRVSSQLHLETGRTPAQSRTWSERNPKALPRIMRAAAITLAVIGLALIAAFSLAKPEPTQATLVVAYGEVTITQPNTIFLFIKSNRTLVLSEGDALTIGAGDMIEVAADSAAQLALLDGSNLDLYANTVLTVDELTVSDTEPLSVQFGLISGRVFNRVQRLLGTDDTFDIRTPSSTASVRGTQYGVEVISVDSSYFNTAEGSVSVEMGGQEVLVNAGEELVAVMGQPLKVTPISDRTPPAVAITSPTSPVAAGSSVLVAGQTEPEAIVRINDTLVNVDEDGFFAYELTVDQPAIIIEASDRYGNTTRIQLDS
jgi:ferric-dicitrate binding protein FerR (iron transport regulator)